MRGIWIKYCKGIESESICTHPISASYIPIPT